MSQSIGFGDRVIYYGFDIAVKTCPAFIRGNYHKNRSTKASADGRGEWQFYARNRSAKSIVYRDLRLKNDYFHSYSYLMEQR